MITWLAIAWVKEKKPTMTGALTGAVAGLATITPAAGFVPPWAAALIGLASAIVCYAAVRYRVRRGWDDALDVWGVHGVGGILGVVLTGVFASAAINGVKGLVEGDSHQFLVQCEGVAITAIYSFIVTYLLLKVIDKITPVRVPEEAEEKGLDTELHGETAYDLQG